MSDAPVPVTMVTVITKHGMVGLPMATKGQQEVIFSTEATAMAAAEKASEAANKTIVAAVASNTEAVTIMASELAAASATTVWVAAVLVAAKEAWQLEHHLP